MSVLQAVSFANGNTEDSYSCCWLVGSDLEPRYPYTLLMRELELQGCKQMLGWHSSLWQDLASTPSTGSTSSSVNTTGSDLVDQAGFTGRILQ